MMGEYSRGNDLQLARGVARGDEACMAAFFQAYHANVYRYMLCLTANAEDAEDLAQDSLLQAASRIGSFRGDSSLKSWVHSVAYRTFTHWSRRRKKQTELSPQAVWAESPFGQVDAAESLIQALARIGPALAQPIVLQEINDLSIDEIAEVLAIPAGTVKSRLFTARERLRQLLGGSPC